MDKFTPGPWTLGKWPGGNVVETSTTNRLFTIQPLAAEGREAHEANARLVAAAPDLLAALEEFERAELGKREDESDPEWHDRLDDVLTGLTVRARSAIAEAKGE